MTVEQARQMCDAPADSFSAGEWCEAANVLRAAIETALAHLRLGNLVRAERALAER